jgi:hypothetical protein
MAMTRSRLRTGMLRKGIELSRNDHRARGDAWTVQAAEDAVSAARKSGDGGSGES